MRAVDGAHASIGAEHGRAANSRPVFPHRRRPATGHTMWRILLSLLTLAVPALAAGRHDPVTLVGLHGRDESGLRALLVRQRDPASPDHERWLTPAEFGRGFGARPRDLKRASRWLRARGCRVQRFANRQLLACTGPHVDDVPADMTPLVADLVQPDQPTVHPYVPRMTGVRPFE